MIQQRIIVITADSDLEAYVVPLLDTSRNMQVVSSDSVIFGDLKIDSVVAWKQLVHLCLALGITTYLITREINKKSIHRIDNFSGFAPHKVTPEVKFIYDTLSDIYQFLHVCGRNALPNGTY
jgi:hypothetical protein